jgi:hypothetical protein
VRGTSTPQQFRSVRIDDRYFNFNFVSAKGIESLNPFLFPWGSERPLEITFWYLNPKNDRLEACEGFMYVLAKFHTFGSVISVPTKATIVIGRISSKKTYCNMFKVWKVSLEALEP